MSLYLVIWIVICFFGIKDFLFRATYKVKNREFKLLLIILLVMLTLRFGQGTDYFAYRYIYNRLSPDGFDTLNCHTNFLLHAQQYSRCSVLLDFVNISRLILHLF